MLTRKRGVGVFVFCGVGLLGAVTALHAFLPQSPHDARDREEREREQRMREVVRYNRQMYHFHGVIQGRVTFADGQPAVGYWVYARYAEHQTGKEGEGDAPTDANGRYRIERLHPEAFVVGVEEYKRPHILSPTLPVHLDRLPDQQANDMDIVVRPVPIITVRVHDAETGQPNPSIPVETDVSGITAVTDANGEARIPMVRMLSNVRLTTDCNKIMLAPGYTFPLYLNNEPRQDRVWEVKTYKVYNGITPLSTFKGVVFGPDEKPAAGADVWLGRTSGGRQHTTTDQAGKFAFQAFRVQGFDNAPTGYFVQAEKDGGQALLYPTASQTWETMTLRLVKAPKATLFGTVTDANGQPEAGVPVVYYDHYSNIWRTQRGGVTDAKGRFVLSDLWPGTPYPVRFGDPPLENVQPRMYQGPVFWGQVNYSGLGRHMPPLRLGERLNLGRIIVPKADAELTGQVADGLGRPASVHYMITVEGRHTSLSRTTDPAGHFRFEHVVREPLTLRIYKPYHENTWRGGPKSPDIVYQTTVQADNKNLHITVW